MDLENAEGVAHHPVLPVRRHQNGAIPVAQKVQQLPAVILLAAGPEEVRPAGVVDIADLDQQLLQAGDIPFLGISYVYLSSSLSVFGGIRPPVSSITAAPPNRIPAAVGTQLTLPGTLRRPGGGSSRSWRQTGSSGL